jgi:hypothetical protein
MIAFVKLTLFSSHEDSEITQKVINILSRHLHEIPWISAADRCGLRIHETVREVTHEILLHVGRELPSLR